MTSPLLDGPRLAPAAGGAADSLVVLLHGYGADGRDLIELGGLWAPRLPRTAFVAPHGPEPCAGNPFGRQWFGYVERNDRERWAGVQSAHATLEAFLDAELARYGLADDRLALVGFSQGTMMALHTGLRRARAPAGILGYSGIHVVGPAHPGAPEERFVRPPVLLVHGSHDEVIPASALARARVSLAALGITPRHHLAPGLGHGIDEDGLDLGGRFLAEVLAG
ncbi:alpha/beta hydrolase [Ancylobacter terrae]|uniref:alpha/beta hydrolase n=1 Tax=Ancylobacter sp. sgz301288 TaxID=3342077 RepID=UPI00385D852E